MKKIENATAITKNETDHSPSQEDETVTKPAKLIRIATMIKTMLDEVRNSSLDEAGRKHLAAIHTKSVEELKTILSPELREELQEVVLPFQTKTTPSDSELRIAQAQLVGWLEELFHGIQATLFTQHIAAQSQIEEMRQKSLTGGNMTGTTPEDASGGTYL